MIEPHTPRPQDLRTVGQARTDDEPVPAQVAHGDRRDEVRLEDDPRHVARVRHTFKPKAPLPRDEHSGASQSGPAGEDLVVQDVEVATPGPSVWDARPEED